MKRTELVSFLITLFMPFLLAEKAMAASDSTTNAVSPSNSIATGKASGPAILSDKEIAELKSEWKDAESGKEIAISVEFSAVLPAPENKAKFEASGAIPFRITAAMTETRVVKGRTVERLLTGDKARLCVFDKDNKVIVNEIVPLIKLCAT